MPQRSAVSRSTEASSRKVTWGLVLWNILPALVAGHLFERFLLTRYPNSDLLLIGAPVWVVFLVWAGSMYLTVKVAERWGLR